VYEREGARDARRHPRIDAAFGHPDRCHPDVEHPSTNRDPRRGGV
jgi:hypothetical protein